MKKLFYLFVLFTSLAYSQKFDWQWLNSYPTGSNLNDAVILSSTRYVCAGDKSAILLSTDAGLTWAVSYPDSATGMRDIYEMSFPTASIGYAAGTNGLLMKTTNGGSTWQQLTAPSPSTLWYVHFVTADTGYICGNSTTFFKTTNGGESFFQVVMPAISTTLYKLHFISPRVGYLGTGSSTLGRLLKTTDYGTTWNMVGGFTGTGTVRGIYFLDENTGYVSDANYAIHKTTDGGLTWNTQDLGTGTFYEVKFWDTNNGAAAGASGQVYVTSDAGTTWNLTNTGYSSGSNVYGIALEGNVNLEGPAVTSMLAVGEGGIMAKSGNLGVTWTPLAKSPSRDDFRQIEMVTPMIGYASGGSTSTPAHAAILKTIDGGVTWNLLNFSGNYMLYAQDWINANVGYVAGRGNDGFYKTTDGGATFTQMNTGVGTATALWYALAFANENVGYAVNGNGLMVKTTNGGTSWFEIISGHGTSPIYDIHLFDSNNLVTAGGSGKVYKTTDGGTSWAQMPTNATTALYGMTFINQNTGFVVGVNGKVYKTTDGFNFSEVFSGVTNNLYHIVFTSATHGWLSGNAGEMAYTTDGGNSWTKSIKFPSNSLIYAGSVAWPYIYWAGVNGNIIRGFADPNTVPVELSSFTAAADNGNITLNWQTATEVNNRGFYLERKSAGGSFESIGFISGKGNSVSVNNYSYTDKNIAPGSYTYRLKQVDFDGTYEYSKNVNVDLTGSFTYALEQNYPNPFNPVTEIRYSTAKDELVQLTLYNSLGEKVKEIFKGYQSAGSHSVMLNAADLSSGIYFYRIDAGSFSQVRKLTLMK